MFQQAPEISIAEVMCHQSWCYRFGITVKFHYFTLLMKCVFGVISPPLNHNFTSRSKSDDFCFRILIHVICYILLL